MVKLLDTRKGSFVLVSAMLVTMALLSGISIGTAHAAPTPITAYQSTIAVNVHNPYSAAQWTDTATFTEPNSGITFAVKQNTTGWLFLMSWKTSQFYCLDAACFGGIEIGSLANTSPMGDGTNPTIMILASTSFKNNVDEFISTGEQTPSTVDSYGYSVQTVCGLTLTGTVSSGQYTAVCYRPFTLKNASPYDLKLGVGTTIEIAFTLGEFNNPGEHAATDMATYTLTFSGSTFTGSGTSSTTSSSTTSSSTTSSSTTSSHSTTSSTSSSSTTSSSTTSSSSTSSSSTTSSSTTSSSTTTSKSSSSSSTTSSTTSSSSTLVTPVTAISVASTSGSYSGVQSGVISGTLTGGSTGFLVTLSVTNPAGAVVFATTAGVGSNASYSATFTPGGSSLWVSGTYTVTASYGSFKASSTFSYSPSSAASTVVSTVTTTSPTTVTVTGSGNGQGSTVTTTQTTTVTTSSGSIPSWVYAVIVVLLLVGLAVGYMARNLMSANRNRPAVSSTA